MQYLIDMPHDKNYAKRSFRMIAFFAKVNFILNTNLINMNEMQNFYLLNKLQSQIKHH